MKELQIFAFGDNLVRTVQKDGEPWWIARDVCAVLGLDKDHKPVPKPEARTDEYYKKRPCVQIVEDGARAIEKVLLKENEL